MENKVEKQVFIVWEIQAESVWCAILGNRISVSIHSYCSEQIYLDDIAYIW